MSFRPWFLLPPKLAHDLVPPTLNLLQHAVQTPDPWRSVLWRGIQFQNPIGVAGGVDKNGTMVKAFEKLGAGFIEVGTVTPLPQEPNPGRILDRDVGQKALWNKMGFPNQGAQPLLNNLYSIRQQGLSIPLLVNIGKNRNTPNESASEDYCQLLTDFKTVADILVINISSPNTKGLRNLQGRESLTNLLKPIMKTKHSQKISTPILVKLSPDLSDSELDDALTVTSDLGVDGWVLTNTTTIRAKGLRFPVEGGVSGAPLTELSRTALTKTIRFLGNQKKDRLIISVGGILDGSEAKRRLDLGADLVQIYTAFIFEGPFVFRKFAKSFLSQ